MTKTLLYDRHVALGGRMVPFAGWAAVRYTAPGPASPSASIGLFDIDRRGSSW